MERGRTDQNNVWPKTHQVKRRRQTGQRGEKTREPTWNMKLMAIHSRLIMPTAKHTEFLSSISFCESSFSFCLSASKGFRYRARKRFQKLHSSSKSFITSPCPRPLSSTHFGFTSSFLVGLAGAASGLSWITSSCSGAIWRERRKRDDFRKGLFLFSFLLFDYDICTTKRLKEGSVFFFFFYFFLLISLRCTCHELSFVCLFIDCVLNTAKKGKPCHYYTLYYSENWKPGPLFCILI